MKKYGPKPQLGAMTEFKVIMVMYFYGCGLLSQSIYLLEVLFAKTEWR